MKNKSIFINTIIIFIICSIFHFVYDIIPCFLTSLFFPVNESIVEHLKMIFTSTVVFTIINDMIHHNKNTFFRAYIASMLTILILLVIYLPINYIFGEIMIVTLIILFISIYLSQYIISTISKDKYYKKLNIISIILLITNFLLFSIFTYMPPKLDLFLDKKHNKYGIDILNK